MSQAIANSYNSAFNPTEHLAGQGDELDKDAFLMLMVTQFQYQDPLNPSEDTEFVAQLAQFSSLEQMQNMNSSMEGLVEASNKQLTVGAASFIGLDVSAQGYGLSVSGGESTTMFYAHDTDVASGSVNIFDSNSQMVATIPLNATTAGVHEFNWDGKLANGATAADGVYTVSLSLLDADGEPVVSDVQVTGTVDGVSTYNGEQYLRMTDGRVVSLAQVREILQPEATPSVDSSEDTDADTAVDPTEGGTDISVSGGVVPSLYYTIDEDITESTITIYNSDKEEVASVSGSVAKGEHEFSWAGNGSDGDYTVKMSAEDSDGYTVDIELRTTK